MELPLLLLLLLLLQSTRVQQLHDGVAARDVVVAIVAVVEDEVRGGRWRTVRVCVVCVCVWGGGGGDRWVMGGS